MSVFCIVDKIKYFHFLINLDAMFFEVNIDSFFFHIPVFTYLNMSYYPYSLYDLDSICICEVIALILSPPVYWTGTGRVFKILTYGWLIY